MSPDVKGLLISYVFLFSMVALGELIRIRFRLPTEFTRKVIHIGVGFWGFLAYYLIQNVWIAIIPPASFVIINTLSFKWSLLKAMEQPDRGNLGTIYYPMALVFLLLAFWTNRPEVVLSGLLAMAMGDGMASVIGRRFGKHPYIIWGMKRTFEGSAAMFVFAAIGIFLVQKVCLSFGIAAILGRVLILALLATVVEAFSPEGLDNLTVPVSTAVTYMLFF